MHADPSHETQQLQDIQRVHHRELQTIGALAHGKDLLRELVLKVQAAHSVRRLFR